MNDTALINIGLQSLLPATAGWLLARWFIKDARHRAWTALLALAAAVTLPLALRALPQSAESVPAILIEAPIGARSAFPEGAGSVRLEPAQITPPVPEHYGWISFFKTLPWRRVLVSIWLTGSAALLLFEALRFVRNGRWRRSLRLPSPQERQKLPALAASSPLRVSEQPVSPCLAGWLRPVVVVPADAFHSWSAGQWRWMLAHENEHCRGGDTWSAGLLRAIRIWLWWNPLAHTLISQWEQAREEVCDAAAVADRQEEAPAYSSFLLDLAARGRVPSPPMLAMAASRPAKRLQNRLEALLAERPVAPRLHPLFAVAALLFLSLAAVSSRSLGLDAPAQAAADPAGPFITRAFQFPLDFDGADDPKAWLSELGMTFPMGTTAVFNRSTNQLVLRHTSEVLAQTEEWLQKWRAGDEFDWRQVYLTTKWIEMPDNVLVEFQRLVRDSRPELILTDPQFQVVIRMLSQQKGVDLFSSPSVTAKFDQHATVEVRREVLVEPGSRQDFAGVQTGFTASLRDGEIELAVDADLGVAFQEGRRLRLIAWDKKTAAPIKIAHLSASKTASLPDGHTLVLSVGQPEPNRRVLLCVTANMISPAGEKVSADDLRQLAAAAAQAPPLRLPAAKEENRRVRLQARMLEENGDEALLAAFLAKPADEKDAASPGQNIAPPPESIVPTPLALGGVLTADQLAVLLDGLKKKPSVRLTELEVRRVISGKTDVAVIGAEQSLQVTPVISGDGYTVDLALRFRNEGEKPQGPTTVTIWSGQTVILSGIIEVDAEGKPAKTRTICVTAEIEP